MLTQRIVPTRGQQANLKNRVTWWGGRAAAQRSGRFGWDLDPPVTGYVTWGAWLPICKTGIKNTHMGGGCEGMGNHGCKLGARGWHRIGAQHSNVPSTSGRDAFI